MLLQLHHQGKDGSVTFPDSFCAQIDIDPKNGKAMQGWFKEIQESYPVPEGMMWMVCNEKSKHFLMTRADINTYRATQ